MHKIVKTVLLTALIFAFNSCKANQRNEDNPGKADIKSNEIEISYKDYEVIEYNEVELLYNNEEIQMYLKIKVINMEKMKILENTIEPKMTIEFNNKKYTAKGNPLYSSSIPPDCDFFFGVGNNGKILPVENSIIGLIGFKRK